MIGRILPRSFDNAYRGHWLAIWLLVPIVGLRLMINFNSVVFTRFVATGPDAIPLDRYGGDAAAMALYLFALLGLALFLLALLGVLALIRYRTMIPLIYLLFLTQQLGAKAIALAHPVASAGGSGGHDASIMVTALLAMGVIGFGLSLLQRPPT